MAYSCLNPETFASDPIRTDMNMEISGYLNIWMMFIEKSQSKLIGGFKPSEKYEFVNWDDENPNIWENHL